MENALASQIWKTASCIFSQFPVPEGSSEANAGTDSPVSQPPSPSHQESAIMSHFSQKQEVTLRVVLLLWTVWGELRGSIPARACVFWPCCKVKPSSLPQASPGPCELWYWEATSPSAPDSSSSLARDKLVAEVWLWVERGEATSGNYIPILCIY